MLLQKFLSPMHTHTSHMCVRTTHAMTLWPLNKAEPDEANPLANNSTRALHTASANIHKDYTQAPSRCCGDWNNHHTPNNTGRRETNSFQIHWGRNTAGIAITHMNELNPARCVDPMQGITGCTTGRKPTLKPVCAHDTTRQYNTNHTLLGPHPGSANHRVGGTIIKGCNAAARIRAAMRCIYLRPKQGCVKRV